MAHLSLDAKGGQWLADLAEWGRSGAPDNRRQRLLGFAPDALPMVAVLADIQRCSMEPLFAGFTAQEQQTLQDYLRRMDANLLRELNKE